MKGIFNVFSIESDYDVTSFQTSLISRASFGYIDYQNALFVLEAELLRKIRVKGLNLNAKISPDDLALADNTVHDTPGHIGRNSKPYALIATGSAEYRIIDTNQHAVRID